MQGQVAFAAGATLVAVAFALSTLERWLEGRARHHAAWTVSLTFFAAGSAALWAGAGMGWSEWTFRLFYLFGGILNVPFLALGTIYLLGGQRLGDRVAAAISLAGAFAVGVLVIAPMEAIPGEELPRGSEVFGALPRVLAAVASTSGALVIIGGAVWSAVRLLRGVAGPPGISPRRLALANLLIAAGAIVLSASGLLNSVLGEMNAFTVSLALGIVLIFVGFLATGRGPRRRAQGDPPWLRDLLSDDGGDGGGEPEDEREDGGNGDGQRSARRSTLPPMPWGSSSTNMTFEGHL